MRNTIISLLLLVSYTFSFAADSALIRVGSNKSEKKLEAQGQVILQGMCAIPFSQSSIQVWQNGKKLTEISIKSDGKFEINQNIEVGKYEVKFLKGTKILETKSYESSKMIDLITITHSC